MKIEKFKEIASKVKDLGRIKCILEEMQKGTFVEISCYGSDKLRVCKFDPLYPQLKEILTNFVSEVEKEVEMISFKEESMEEKQRSGLLEE